MLIGITELYEPSRKNSYKEYYNQSLLIFSSLDHLNNYRNQGFLDSNKLIYNHKFKKFPDSNTYKLTEQFHFPLIKSVDKDIKVIGVILPVSDLSYLDTLPFPYPPLTNDVILDTNRGDFINSSDLFKDSTDLAKGYVCIDYNIDGINEFKPVILLNTNELNYLRKSLLKMIHVNGSLNEMKRCFEHL